ncbi:hypothetical protein EGI20_12000, partial [Aquitalea sp. S1-19]|nr:hypothetical protein [Aquitalea sp. S1-19]
AHATLLLHAFGRMNMQGFSCAGGSVRRLLWRALEAVVQLHVFRPKKRAGGAGIRARATG